MRRSSAGCLALLAWTLPGGACAAFHPREDRPYRYDVDETRTADGVVRRFHATRSVVFRRVDGGYDAVVTLDAAAQEAGTGVGVMFEAATAALLNRPLRFRLDAAGRVTGVADADATLARIADAIERIAAGTARQSLRAPASQALATPLRAAAPERKAAMLSSILQQILFADVGEAVVGSRTVTMPSRPPLAPGGVLAGTETIARAGTMVTIELAAEGVLATGLPPDVPGASLAAGTVVAPGVTIRAVRTVDAATGLLRDGRETSDTVVPGAYGPRHTVVETTTTVRLTHP